MVPLLLLVAPLLLLVALCSVSTLAHTAPASTITSIMRFPRLKHTFEDTWPEFQSSPIKLKRWTKENGTVEHADVNMEAVSVDIQPVDESSPDFNLYGAGFERVELHPRILPLLRHIKAHGLSGNRVGPTTAGGNIFFGKDTDDEIEDKLARELQGRDSFSLGNNVWHYCFRCAGFVIRKGGPEGSKLDGSGFDQVAQRVHIDQDLSGEPLLSMGLAWIFKLPYMYLINVWSPLHDIRMRPMAFVDQRTVDLARDVLRYRTNSTANAGGRGGSFASDRLMSLHHSAHRWYYYPDTRFGQAIAWNTGTIPHSSFTLPGEEVLSVLRDQLQTLECSEAGRAQVEQVLAKAAPGLALDMDAQIGAAMQFKRRACEGRASQEDLAFMLEYLTRASLEIRCVTLVVPSGLVMQVKLAVGSLCAVLLAGRWWGWRRRQSN